MVNRVVCQRPLNSGPAIRLVEQGLVKKIKEMLQSCDDGKETVTTMRGSSIAKKQGANERGDAKAMEALDDPFRSDWGCRGAEHVRRHSRGESHGSHA